ncbi:MAG: carboxypeptidase regulatory-like domain-containing protein, partial [Xanthomonadales bacterium]|nr:carboxypeptidase regulatory-like domain-containing protein [Xanthomonadales bacterium]
MRIAPLIFGVTMFLCCAVARARVCLLALLWLVAVVVPGLAQATSPTPAMQQGVAWLTSQVQANGSLHNEDASIATPYQAQATAVLALSHFGAVPSALANTVAASTEGNTEYISRRILAAAASGYATAADITTLLALQNDDGGWGISAAYASDALDTAMALQALHVASPTSADAVGHALYFLVQAKHADGGWGMAGQSSIYITAHVLRGAQAWASTLSSADSTAASAAQWLLGVRSSALVYADTFNNALALLALESRADQSAALPPLLAALGTAQLADGSWAEDPYLTALVLRAQWLANQVPDTQTTGVVDGVIVDLATGSPLAGATVSLLENADSHASSNVTGAFALSDVPQGSYTLVASLTGYVSRNFSVTVNRGQATHVGSIALVLIPTTATLSGVVKDSNSQPLQNVIVAVGTRSAITDGQGSYTVTGIAPGPAAITASLTGYRSVSANVDFAVGTTYLFSPTLYANNVTPPPATVQGVVIDANSKLPLANVTVSLGSLQLVTGSDGKFVLSNVSVGAQSITFAAAGYQGQTASLTVAAGVNDIGDVPMQAVPSTSTLHGHVFDAQGNTIANASVDLGGGKLARSDAGGAYRLADLQGTRFTATISAAGFVTQGFAFSIHEPGDITQDFHLVATGVNALQLGPLTVAPSTAPSNTNLSVSA